MYSGALAACKKVSGVPFYLETRDHNIIFLDDFSVMELRGVDNLETFLQVNGFDIARSVERVNSALTQNEQAALERSEQRGLPFGDDLWTEQTVRRLGLESTARPRGRPRKLAWNYQNGKLPKRYLTPFSSGQGRYRSFPVQDDDHFHVVSRYVERNALTANLVKRAEDYRWGSLYNWLGGTSPITLATWPVRRLPNWVERVNSALTQNEQAALERSEQRGLPFGDDLWTEQTVRRLGLESTARPRGRPRKLA